MIPGTKPARKKNPPLSALQQEKENPARQTAAEISSEKTPELLDRRAAIAATIPAFGNMFVKLLRASNNLRHAAEEEWKKSR